MDGRSRRSGEGDRDRDFRYRFGTFRRREEGKAVMFHESVERVVTGHQNRTRCCGDHPGGYTNVGNEDRRIGKASPKVER
jgi:hypothetical protein